MKWNITLLTSVLRQLVPDEWSSR